MTLQECYSLLGGNYEDALSRLMNERLVQKFLIRFIDDPTMDSLLLAVETHDIEKSFVSAHTLKGVAANLALSSLHMRASELTEQLRNRMNEADPTLLNNLMEVYSKNIETIKQYMQSVE